MKKKISIEGMMCNHCKMHVEEALKELKGVEDVKVSLEDKNAVITSQGEISDKEIKDTIEDVGYEAVKIESL